jgi:hypothetical protein
LQKGLKPEKSNVSKIDLLNGYLFQVIESMILPFCKSMGEEIFVSAVKK